MDNKIKYFEYFVYRIIGREFNFVLTSGQEIKNYNKLKLLKLLFFASAIKVQQDDGKEKDLLDIFDNFHAMPYGPVESDIYNHINDLTNFQVNNDSLVVKQDAKLEFDSLNGRCRSEIDAAIDAIMKESDKLCKLDAFELVELSHKSEAWKMVYQNARSQGQNSLPMSANIIKKTKVYFK